MTVTSPDQYEVFYDGVLAGFHGFVQFVGFVGRVCFNAAEVEYNVTSYPRRCSVRKQGLPSMNPRPGARLTMSKKFLPWLYSSGLESVQLMQCRVRGGR
jgi:hypothetical protein